MIRFKRFIVIGIIAVVYGSAANSSTHSQPGQTARSAGYSVDVHVENSMESPIGDAYVWMGPHNTVYDVTDNSGDATVTSDISTNYILVARHRLYSRVAPVYIDLTGDTNVTIVLPPFTYIRVASYNMEGNRDNGQWNDEQIMPLARMFWTVQPDIVLLQECPGSGFLFSDFAEEYLPGYESAESTEGYYIHNGICSFYPIEENISEGESVMTRDLYGARIAVNPETEFTCLTAHFKAGSDTSDREQRNVEAQFTGEYCSNLLISSTPYIFGGDLNDDPGYPRPPSVIFDILNNSGAEFLRLDPQDDGGSTVTIPAIPRRYDFLMPVSTVADDVIQMAVFRTETLQILPAWLNRTDSALASDHRMIYADIAVVPEPGAVMGIIVFLVCSRVIKSDRQDISSNI